jgi:L-iditol 2-dehydrogenase
MPVVVVSLPEQDGQRVGVAPNIGCGHCEMCGRALMNMCRHYSAFGIDRDGAHTEFVRIPAAAIAQGNVIPLPETRPAADWVLCEPVSCAINGVRAARVGCGDAVLIYGAGPMGLLNLLVALHSGATRLIMVDFNADRLEHAGKLGATDLVNPQFAGVLEWVEKETLGRGVDVVITAAPVRQAQVLADRRAGGSRFLERDRLADGAEDRDADLLGHQRRRLIGSVTPSCR